MRRENLGKKERITMTTQKQAAANKANAQKSTGATTPEGKSVVATNAIRHGILSQRLFLEGEAPDEFASLQDDLRRSLKPVGTLELVLVEKIAVALWRQRRLIAAESAIIERDRSMRLSSNRTTIKAAMGLGFSYPDVSEDEIAPMTTEAQEQINWCNGVVAEFVALDESVLDTNDLARLEADAPLMWGQFTEEAEEEGASPADYLAQLEDGLGEWARDVLRWCQGEIGKIARKGLVEMVAGLVRAEKSAPISHEVLMRYQIALDGELYRAMEQLRKQQEWRIESGVEIDAEVLAA